MTNTQVRFTSNNDTIDQGTVQDIELQSDDYDAIETKEQNELNKTSDFETSSQQVTDKSKKSTRKAIHANTHVSDISNIDTIDQGTAPEIELHSADYVTIQPKKKKERNHTSDFETLSQHVNNRSRKFISHSNTMRAHPHKSVIGYNGTIGQRFVQEIGLQSRKLTPRRKIAISGILLAVIVFVVFMYIFAQCIIEPCVNGKCVNGIGNYRCSCYDGFNGTDCEQNFVSEQCIPESCVNGKCISGKGYYKCSCYDGFYGTDCEHNNDECSSDPCVNATCYDWIDKYSCLCNEGFNGTDCEQLITTDCADILRYTGNRTDGIYTVRTWKVHQPINVYCDMTTDGGGWTVFQNRFDGSVDFYRNFSEYDTGFGNFTTEFWLGLSNIQEIAGQGQTDLRIGLEAANGTKAYETFNNFYLSPGPAYTLHLGRTIASLRISSPYGFGGHHNGSGFSTYDHDVDSSSYSCAVSRHGAWWYNYCATANLNGRYLTPGTNNYSSMNYYSFLYTMSLKTSKMMMRRK